ncbi:MAG: hypothetical protein IKV87_01910 [Methanobrevibacter sp.]|nr:hypothetical protein [Methanobrevibacter sp.]
MNKKILLLTLVILTIVSLASVSAADIVSDDNDAAATTIEIDNTMTNDEIQAKLDTVTDNSVINFAPGEYNNVSLKVTKDVDVIKEVNVTDENGTTTTENQTVTEKTTLNNIKINGNGATLIGTPAWTNYYDGIFEVANVNGFTLSGFNFICQGVTAANMKTPSCVIIFNTTNGIVEDNNITGGRFGLYVGSKFTNPNVDTIVRNNNVYDASDMGIISFGSVRTKILNNTVINPANHGIDVRHGSGPNCTVDGNTVIGAMEGIYLMHSQGHTATNNIINHCAIGITCYGSSNIKLDSNNFTNKTKIAHFLSSGYSNIQIGENNDYSGIYFSPMPPTFSYYVVRADAAYVSAESGTFSQSDANTNVTYVQVYLPIGDPETLDPLELKSAATNEISEDILALNNNVTVKIWKVDDNNHIDENNTINVTIDGVDYSGLSDTTGAVYVNTSALTPGLHYMAVTFPSTGALKESTWSSMIQVGGEVVQKATEIELKDMVTTTITNGKNKTGEYFVFTLKDSEGKALADKKVSLGFNGAIYNRTTDEKGQAKVGVNLVSAGIYTFAVCFLGDDQYNASFNVAKITVNKQKAKLTVPAKSYKANAKTKTLTATLIGADGVPAKGKKLTFTVNGKSYTGTTNANGVASVKVSLSAKKTYSFTVKFAGDNGIAALTKTAKVTIK